MRNIIESVVCAEYKITKEDLQLKTREETIREARQVCMYYLKIHTKASLQRIGLYYKKDHATVLHSVNTVKNQMDTNKYFNQKIEMMEESILKNKLAISDKMYIIESILTPLADKIKELTRQLESIKDDLNRTADLYKEIVINTKAINK